MHWVDEGMEVGCISYACELAAKANVRKVSYIEAILRNWANAGILTKEQAVALENERMLAKANEPRAGPPKPPPMTEAERAELARLNAELKDFVGALGVMPRDK